MFYPSEAVLMVVGWLLVLTDRMLFYLFYPRSFLWFGVLAFGISVVFTGVVETWSHSSILDIRYLFTCWVFAAYNLKYEVEIHSNFAKNQRKTLQRAIA
ncbi:hypothetical protein F4823DRAFT_569009 [Ustulina deusta]|nr:hypothetical protein F4823DRAFT_569009 [Ustulina deusta]